VEAAQVVLEPYREKATALQKDVKESDVALKKLNDKQLKAEAAHKDVLASVEGPLDSAVQEAAVQLSELDKQRQQKEAAKQRAEEEVKKLKKQRDEFDVSKPPGRSPRSSWGAQFGLLLIASRGKCDENKVLPRSSICRGPRSILTAVVFPFLLSSIAVLECSLRKPRMSWRASSRSNETSPRTGISCRISRRRKLPSC
jgi:hypothetical protein